MIWNLIIYVYKSLYINEIDKHTENENTKG